MVQSPSWEANWCAASQEIPRISRNPKVHYRTHKRPPPVSILGQPNPVHIPTSHLLVIHPNIIHPYTPRSPQWFLSLRFPQQDPMQPPFLTHTRHMPSPSHSTQFYHPHNIGWGVQIIRSSLCNLLHSPVTSSLLCRSCTSGSWSLMMAVSCSRNVLTFWTVNEGLSTDVYFQCYVMY